MLPDFPCRRKCRMPYSGGGGGAFALPRDNYACGVRADGTVACWGGGDDTEEPPGGEFISGSAGSTHNCGVGTDGSVACWGGGYGALPLAVSERPPEGDLISVSVGNTHSCGVRTDGSVACWGWGSRRSILAARGRLCLRQRRKLPHLRDKGRRLRRLLGL